MPTRFSDYDGREVTVEIQAAWLLARGVGFPEPAPAAALTVEPGFVPVQYLAGLIEGAIWQERPGETTYSPRPELVEAWAADIAPYLESYLRAWLLPRLARTPQGETP